MDECILQTDNCNRTSHFCVNTRGSFTCQQKSGPTDCIAGYKYSAEQKICIGMTDISLFTTKALLYISRSLTLDNELITKAFLNVLHKVSTLSWTLLSVCGLRTCFVLVCCVGNMCFCAEFLWLFSF